LWVCLLPKYAPFKGDIGMYCKGFKTNLRRMSSQGARVEADNRRKGQFWLQERERRNGDEGLKFWV